MRPTRAEAVSTLEEGHAALRRLLGALSEEELARPATIGGGDWSAADLAGHVAHWEERALATLEDWRAGRRPAVEEVFASDGVDRVNAEDVERKRAIGPLAVLELAERTHADLIGALGDLGPEEWTARAAYPTRRRTTLDALLGSVLGAPRRPFGHAFAHLPDLEAYVGSLVAR